MIRPQQHRSSDCALKHKWSLHLTCSHEPSLRQDGNDIDFVGLAKFPAPLQLLPGRNEYFGRLRTSSITESLSLCHVVMGQMGSSFCLTLQSDSLTLDRSCRDPDWLIHLQRLQDTSAKAGRRIRLQTNPQLMAYLLEATSRSFEPAREVSLVPGLEAVAPAIPVVAVVSELMQSKFLFPISIISLPLYL